jgi:hypothetical protein
MRISCTVKHLSRVLFFASVAPIDPIFEHEGAQKGAQHFGRIAFG